MPSQSKSLSSRRTSRRTSKRIPKQASRRTSKQTSRRTPKQASRRTSKQTSRRISTRNTIHHSNPRSNPLTPTISRSETTMKRLIKMVGITGVVALSLFMFISRFDGTSVEPLLHDLRVKVETLIRRLQRKLTPLEMQNIQKSLEMDPALLIEQDVPWLRMDKILSEPDELVKVQLKWRDIAKKKPLRDFSAAESEEIRKELARINKLAQYLHIVTPMSEEVRDEYHRCPFDNPNCYQIPPGKKTVIQKPFHVQQVLAVNNNNNLSDDYEW